MHRSPHGRLQVRRDPSDGVDECEVLLLGDAAERELTGDGDPLVEQCVGALAWLGHLQAIVVAGTDLTAADEIIDHDPHGRWIVEQERLQGLPDLGAARRTDLERVEDLPVAPRQALGGQCPDG
jgi:hypothetical protein